MSSKQAAHLSSHLPTHQPPYNILFTGGRSPATLALIRRFAEAGHRCDVAESLQPNLAGASRACSKNFTVPAPRQHTAAYIRALQAIIVEREIDLLIPTCEETFYIAQHREALESTGKGCEVFTSDIASLHELHSKYRFNQLLQRLKLPAPATERICNRDQLKTRLRKWKDYVLKAEFSRFASAVYMNAPRHKVYANVHPTPHTPWVLQEYLAGPQFCSYSVARQGKLTAHSVYPTIYTAGPGATIYFTSVDIPEIERIVHTLVAYLGYTGQISFDFILCQGVYYPIECNPRTTTGTFLFEKEDDLPRAFLPPQTTLTPPIATLRPPTRRPVALSIAMIAYAIPQNPLQTPRILKDLWRAHDPLIKWQDPGPFWQQFGMLFRTLQQAKKAGTDLLSASTLDIEWNGENCALDTKQPD